MNNSVIDKADNKKQRMINLDAKSSKSFAYGENSSFFSPTKRTAYNTPVKGKR
jgi:hypothetical protein